MFLSSDNKQIYLSIYLSIHLSLSLSLSLFPKERPLLLRGRVHWIGHRSETRGLRFLLMFESFGRKVVGGLFFFQGLGFTGLGLRGRGALGLEGFGL